MRKSAIALLAVLFTFLSGGAVVALGEQQQQYQAARASYESSLTSLDEAVQAAKRAAEAEELARTELAETIDTSKRAIDTIGSSTAALTPVAETVERNAALLAATRTSPPSAPQAPQSPTGTDQYLRETEGLRAAQEKAEGFVAESESRAEELVAAGERIGGAWGEAAKQTAGEIDAALESNPNSSEETRNTLAAIAGKLKADGFELTDEIVGEWAGVAASLTALAGEEEAYQEAQRAAAAKAAAAAPKYTPPRAGSSGGGSGAPSGGGSSGGGVPASEAGGVLGETNAYRIANGLGALSNNGTLVSFACNWASALATRDAGLSHASYPGVFTYWGENVASGYVTASSVVSGWMGSPGHRANILNGNFRYMGACVAQGASGTLYWVQQFGG